MVKVVAKKKGNRVSDFNANVDKRKRGSRNFYIESQEK